MIKIFEKDSPRFSEAYEKIRLAYLHENKEPAIVISDVNSYLSGEIPNLIPDDYFENVEVMSQFQIKKIKNHLERYDDDYIPVLFPWFGTGVVPSALGCKTIFNKKLDPAVGGAVIFKPEDIKKLTFPDPYRDGLMPKVLKCIDYMRENYDCDVSFTDCQGPLNIAICLCGVENLFIWMYEYPQYVHEIMEFCTETLIRWVKVQKKHTGSSIEAGAYPHCLALPEGFGGVCISDDDLTILSPHLYKEFVVPYNSMVLKAFGGGTLHFCGSAEHQLENLLNTEGLTGINNFCMGNIGQIVKMQKLFKNRLAIMACDFAPLDIEKYYTELIDAIDFKGVIISSFVVPMFALVGNNYENISRDRDQVSRQIFETLQRLIHAKK